MELSLTKLPWYGQVGAFVLLAATGVGWFIYSYEMPTRDDFKARQNQLAGLRKDIAMGRCCEFRGGWPKSWTPVNSVSGRP